jgi:glycosyltransferase involved in cell wall biosynthesis
MAILDAMSYELPVVATNVWGNYELVTPGKTGFLINPSSKVQYYDGYYMPQWGNPQFMKDIRHPDIVSINELVEKIKILIENEHLRRKMGATGRFEVEKGKFSIYVRNQKLARIFDEATA